MKGRAPRGRAKVRAIAIATVVVVVALAGCSLDWVVIPKDGGVDASDDGGAESKATLVVAAKLLS